MRKVLSSLFSLFTVVGGHFFNRRLDLGLLFFALLLLLVILSWYGFPMVLVGMGYEDWFLNKSNLILMGYIQLIAIGVIVLASSIVSFIRANDFSARPPIGKAGVLGGTLAILLSLVIVTWGSMTSMNYISFANQPSSSVSTELDENNTSGFRRSSSLFHEAVRYGGQWVDLDQLENLPKGEFYISGRIRFNDTPAQGVHLIAIFNDSYRSDELITDKDGLFSISVPEGEWTLNRIELRNWPDRPTDIALSVTGGIDKPLAERMYDPGPSFSSKGLPLQATESPTPIPKLDLVMRPDLQLQWPKRQGLTANPDQDRVAWQPLAEATSYQLQLHRTKRDGTTTRYFPTTWINTDRTVVPLSDFATIPDDTDKENEYIVRVFAFGKDGELLANSGDFFSGKSLVLKGSSIVKIDDMQAVNKISSLTGNDRQKEMEMRYRDKKRLDAADTLAEEGLTDAARTLVERVAAKSLETETLTTLGIILAGEGRCEEARAKLDAASKKRDKNCYPKLYRDRCMDKDKRKGEDAN